MLWSFLIVLGLCTSLSVRVATLDSLKATLSVIGRTFGMIFTCYLVFSLTDNFASNISVKQIFKVAELNKEVEQVKLFLADQNELLQTLEEGIVVVEDKQLTFANEIFQHIIGKNLFEKMQKNILDEPLLKVFSQLHDSPKSELEVGQVSYISNLTERFASISEIIGKDSKFYKNKVF